MAIRFLILLFIPASSWACISGEIKFTELDKDSVYARIELADGWESAPGHEGGGLMKLRSVIDPSVPLDPISLVKRQMEFFRKKFPQEFAVMNQFVEGQFGALSTSGCFETAMIERLFEIYPMESEISAIIMEKDGKYIAHAVTYGELSVYYSAKFTALIDADFANGWRPYVHFHNHPFVLSNFPNDVAGTLVPSDPDGETYALQEKKWGLPFAWISNGFNTAKFRADEYPRLRSHPEMN